MIQQISPKKSNSQSSQYQDSDSEMFMNLAPNKNNNHKPIFHQDQSKQTIAKMKRLIGQQLVQTNSNLNTKEPIKKYQIKEIKITNVNIKKTSFQSDSDAQSQSKGKQMQQRERSRDKKSMMKTAQSIKQREIKNEDAAILMIQKQKVKQNDNLISNKMEQKKLQKFAEMQKLLYLPVQQLPILRKNSEQIKQQKRQKKRLDRMMQKKYKEYKVGKVKDQASNCVFNGIEDYFM